MPRQYAREPLSIDEGTRLIQACDTLRERQVILILLDTGLRVSELAQLTKQHILWQERRLAIQGKGGPSGKHSKRRVLPMTDRVRLLIAHHDTMQDRVGITARRIERIVKRVANRAGIAKRVTPPVLRHTFSVSCIQRGITTRTLQYLLGHDRSTTTELSMHLSPEDAIREFQRKWCTPAATRSRGADRRHSAGLPSLARSWQNCGVTWHISASALPSGAR